MSENTYYLSNAIRRICFRDNYQIELSGYYNAYIASGIAIDIECRGYHDTYGAGKSDAFINIAGDVLLGRFVDSRRKSLGLDASTVFLDMADLAFGISQNPFEIGQRGGLAVFANYKWYTNRKTVDYEYRLGNGTIIHRGRASIKDKGIASYIKHFTRTISSIDISPYA